MKNKDSAPACLNCPERHSAVFCELHENDLTEVTAHRRFLSFKKGQNIYTEGAMPSGIFHVYKGKLKISKLGSEGKEQILRFAKEGYLVGVLPLLNEENYSSSATALEDCMVCFIHKDVFFKLMESNTKISLELLKLLAKVITQSDKRIMEVAQQPVRERMAASLLVLKEVYGYEADGESINVNLSREELASLAGTSRESATRLLAEYEEDEMIELRGKKIAILNYQKLVKTANTFD